MPNYKVTNPTTSTQQDLLGADDTTTSTSYEIVTGFAITLPTRSGGKALVIAILGLHNNTAGNSITCVFYDDGVTTTGDMVNVQAIGAYVTSYALSNVYTLDGSVIALYFKVDANTGKLEFSANQYESKIESFEI